MKALCLLILTTAGLLGAGPAWASASARCAQPSVARPATLRVPKGWREFPRSTFRSVNPGAEARDLGKALADGHQPWRLDPRNVAAACLLEFGLAQGKDVLQVAEDLSPGRTPGTFRLLLKEVTVVVRVQKVATVPLAMELQLVDPCRDPLTTFEMRACAWRRLREAEQEMGATFGKLLGRIPDPDHRELLERAQKDWLRSRESTADFEARFYEGGTLQEQIRTDALERITRVRTKELREILRDASGH